MPTFLSKLLTPRDLPGIIDKFNVSWGQPYETHRVSILRLQFQKYLKKNSGKKAIKKIIETTLEVGSDKTIYEIFRSLRPEEEFHLVSREYALEKRSTPRCQSVEVKTYLFCCGAYTDTDEDNLVPYVKCAMLNGRVNLLRRLDTAKDVKGRQLVRFYGAGSEPIETNAVKTYCFTSKDLSQSLERPHCPAIIKFLLLHGPIKGTSETLHDAIINRNDWRLTALILLLRRYDPESVEQRNKQGKTPREVARAERRQVANEALDMLDADARKVLVTYSDF
jgi:hypothetical protein